MKNFSGFFAVAIASVLTLPAFGQITLDLGNTVLQPDRAGQLLHFSVSSTGTSINGADIFLEIQGNGALPTFNIISNANDNGSITSGVIAEGSGYVFNNAAGLVLDEIAGASDSQAFFAILAGQGIEADANGTLATLTIDTTGISSGMFNLVDLGTGFTDTDSNAVPISSVINGTILISAIPEPGSMLVLSGLGTFLLVRRRRS